MPLNQSPLEDCYSHLRDTRYGIGLHWTTWTADPKGSPAPFERAVAALDVEALAQQLESAGAGHLLFTINHALHWLPCPHPFVDRILPGRTCERDLIADLHRALAPRNIKLALYYHHGCDLPEQDPAWQQAVGGYDKTLNRLLDHFEEIVGWLGEKYQDKFIAWWFDAAYALPHKGDVPWQRLTQAAKRGFASRAITYNSGMGSNASLTPLQDFWPGEAEGLGFRPDSRVGPGGLPWYSFVTWHKGPPAEWGIDQNTLDNPRHTPSVDEVEAFARAYRAVGAAVTFNLLCYRDGTIFPQDLDVMRKLKDRSIV